MLQKVIADTLRIGFRLVALVHCDNDRAARRLGVVDGLDGLRHHRIISRHNKDHDVRDIGTARAHLGKRLVARGVDEGDGVPGLGADLVGTDMLGDAAGFASRDIGAADGVEKACLAVVDMAHHGHHRGPRLQAGRVILHPFETDFDIGIGHALRPVAKLLDNQLGGLAVNRLGSGRHHAKLHQLLDDVGCALGHPVGEFADGQGVGDDHIANLLDLRLLVFAHPCLFPLAADRGKRSLAALVVTRQSLGNGHLAGLATARAITARRCRTARRRILDLTAATRVNIATWLVRRGGRGRAGRGAAGVCRGMFARLFLAAALFLGFDFLQFGKLGGAARIRRVKWLGRRFKQLFGRAVPDGACLGRRLRSGIGRGLGLGLLQAFLEGADAGGAFLSGQTIIGFGLWCLRGRGGGCCLRCGGGRISLRRRGAMRCGRRALAAHLHLDGTPASAAGVWPQLSGLETAECQPAAREAELFGFTTIVVHHEPFPGVRCQWPPLPMCAR